MRPFCGFIALATLLFTLSANRADADPIRLSVTFVASGFRTTAGASIAPVDPVTGSFSITFDNSADLREQSKGITVSNLNILLDGPLGFAYGALADGLIIGSLFNGAQTMAIGTNDILFGIANASTNPRPVDLAYTQRSSDGIFQTFRVTMTFTPVATPEPTTLALLGSGLTVALLQRRRRAPE